MGTESSDEDTEQETSAPEAARPKDGDSAEVAELRAQLAKANSEAAERRRKLKEFEDRDKTDLQKLQDELDEARKDAAAGMRWKVALDKGLTATQAKRLVGETYDELVADADELVADLGLNPEIPDETSDESGDESDDGEMPPPASRPREDLKSGSGATDLASAVESTDTAAIGARMYRR